MATAAILKIVFWLLLVNRLSDIGEILHQEAERHADKGRMTKLQIFKIQDGDISVKLLLDFDKIWFTTAYIGPDEVFKSGIAVSYM